jgi:polyribonucleotide nucleotidyltransferase
MKEESFSIEIGGKELTATFTNLADQATGSVIMQYGNTTVLVTAVLGKDERNDLNYVPLSVEYEEKFYAAGEILGSRFIRREGRPSDDAILSGRVIDRTIRPLFDSRLRKDVQVVSTVLSIDADDPDVLSVNGASIALATSPIPWNGPVSAVRVGKKQGANEYVINPTYAFRSSPDVELDVLLCGKDATITMIEVGAREVAEAVLQEAFDVGMREIARIEAFQKMLVEKFSPRKLETPPAPDTTLTEQVFNGFEDVFETSIFSDTEHAEKESDLVARYVAEVVAQGGTEASARHYFESRVEKLMREKAINEGKRVDGRAPDAIRPLFAQAGGVSSILHGSGIFFRGGTHVLSVLTLGGPEDSQIIDSIEGVEIKKRFMHHYNFPPFSVGATGKIGGLNRRMVGHGALAEKALEPIIPPFETFPYTIRLVSEALASNGSTSMGSVCASTLALMDGGVPIARPVGGIAMGIMYESPERYRILTDIQGPEDHYGDMDFKVAGTEVGVTAIQLDVKVDGLPVAIMQEALAAAKKARLEILAVMREAIATPRDTVSPRVPHIEMLSIPTSMIGMVIGSSGKTLKKIKEESGVRTITIEDDGTVFISGSEDATRAARAQIEDMTRTFTEGDVVEGEVVRITDFGAFVRLSARTDGLIHISEIAPYRIAHVGDVLQVGEMVRAEVKRVDEEGKVGLSIKSLDPDFAKRRGVLPEAETPDSRASALQ